MEPLIASILPSFAHVKLLARLTAIPEEENVHVLQCGTALNVKTVFGFTLPPRGFPSPYFGGELGILPCIMRVSVKF